MGVSAHRRITAKPAWIVALWLALLAAVGALVVLSGMATALREHHPEIVLRFLPSDARASARYADDLLFRNTRDRANIANAAKYARSALAWDVTLPSAWRVMALMQPDGSPKAIHLLQFAQQLSRRDIPTQLALLEWRVEQGDIVGALNHYDIVLRISTVYDSILFSVLSAAATDPQIRPALARRLINAPMWRRRFFSYMANAGTPYEVQADIYEAIARAGPLADRDIVSAQAMNSVFAGQYLVGKRLYELVAPAQALLNLRNGGFEQSGGKPPFDWKLDTDGLLNVAISGSDKGRRLEISSERGDGARAARQILYLRGGHHRIQARFGPLQGYAAGTPTMTLSCADTGAPIATFEGGAGKDRFGAAFTVPDNCQAEWLELGLRPDMDGRQTAIWIDSVAVD